MKKLIAFFICCASLSYGAATPIANLAISTDANGRGNSWTNLADVVLTNGVRLSTVSGGGGSGTFTNLQWGTNNNTAQALIRAESNIVFRSAGGTNYAALAGNLTGDFTFNGAINANDNIEIANTKHLRFQDGGGTNTVHLAATAGRLIITGAVDIVTGQAVPATINGAQVATASDVSARLASNVWATADSTTNYVRRTGDTMTGALVAKAGILLDRINTQTEYSDTNLFIGGDTGSGSISTGIFAMGLAAFNNGRGSYGAAIGTSAGSGALLDDSVAIGSSAAMNFRGDVSVLLGQYAGLNASNGMSHFVGYSAGQGVGGRSVHAFGKHAGYYAQSNNVHAFGYYAAGRTSNAFIHAFGSFAGFGSKQYGEHYLDSFDPSAEPSSSSHTNNFIRLGPALEGGIQTGYIGRTLGQYVFRGNWKRGTPDTTFDLRGATNIPISVEGGSVEQTATGLVLTVTGGGGSTSTLYRVESQVNGVGFTTANGPTAVLTGAVTAVSAAPWVDTWEVANTITTQILSSANWSNVNFDTYAPDNPGRNYNITNDVLTFSSTGLCHVTAAARVFGMSSANRVQMMLYRNGAQFRQGIVLTATTNATPTISVSFYNHAATNAYTIAVIQEDAVAREIRGGGATGAYLVWASGYRFRNAGE